MPHMLPDPRAACWYVWAASMKNELVMARDRALYLGELPATGMHCHPCPVLLLGLSGRFALHQAQHGHTTTHTASSAVVAAGVEHLLDPQGECVALIYLEPDAPPARALTARLAQNGGVLWEPCAKVRQRSLTHDRLRHFDLDALLTRPLPPPCAMEPRVQNALQALRLHAGDGVSRASAAARLHLSASRFNHLFSEHAGVSFRRYKVWCQLRAAIGALAAHQRLTDAALEGAFTDGSHFSRQFRNTFGMTPSSVLRPLRTVTLLA